MADTPVTPDQAGLSVFENNNFSAETNLPAAISPVKENDLRGAMGVYADREAKIADPSLVDRGALDQFGDAWQAEATFNLWKDLTTRDAEPDPNFTPDVFSARLDEAAKVLPERYLSGLGSAVSNEDFDYLFSRAKEAAEAEKRLNSEGLSGFAAQLAAGVLDPATMAAGVGLGKAASIGAKLAKLRGLKGNVAVGGAAGAGSLAVTDAAAPADFDAADYAAVFALSAGIGGLLGPHSNIGKASRDDVPVAAPREAPTTQPATIGDSVEITPYAARLAKIAKDVEKEIDDEIVALTPQPVTVEVGNKASRVARFDTTPAGPAANDNVRIIGPDGPVKASPDARVTAAETPSEAISRGLSDVVTGARPVDEVVEDVLRKYNLTPANDVVTPLRLKKTIGTAEDIRLAESAATYKAPHRNKLPEGMERFAKFDLPAFVERDILHLAGDSVKRLRRMGYDVRVFRAASSEWEKVAGVHSKPNKMVMFNHNLKPERLVAMIEHEEIHALRRSKAITDSEWDELVEATKTLRDESGRTYYDRGFNSASARRYDADVDSGRRTIGDATEAKLEEAVAEMVGNDRILGIEGTPAWRIIKDIKEGKYAELVGQRDGVPLEFSMSDEALAASPAAREAREAPTNLERDFLDRSGFGGIPDSEVPRAFANLGLLRLDIAGYLAQSPNSLVRVLGDLLLNDTVGKAGHAVNGPAKELAKARLISKMNHRLDAVIPDAFAAWVKEDASRSARWYNKADLNRQFQRELGLAIRGVTDEAGISPALRPAVEAHRAVYKEMLAYAKNPLKDYGLQGRGLFGIENVEPNANYITRKFHHGHLNGMIREIGAGNVTALVRNAIADAQPGLSAGDLDRIANAYFNRVRRAVNNVDEDLGSILARGDRDTFARLLREEGLDEETIGRLQGIMLGSSGEVASSPRTMRKTLLNERAFIEVNGKRYSFHDLLDHDADRLMQSYLSNMGGRIAAGQAIYRNPSTGEIVINGILSDTEFDGLLRSVREHADSLVGAENAYSAVDVAKELDYLKFAWDRLMGRPVSAEQGRYADMARFARSTQYHRLISVFFSQTAEVATVLGTQGLRASFQHFPGFKAMFTGRPGEVNRLFQELQAIGVGVDGLHGMVAAHGVDNVRADDILAAGGSARLARAQNVVDTINKGVSNLSRMPHITDTQQVMAAAAMAQNIRNAAVRGLTASDLQRFAQIGLDEPMIARIMEQVRTHATETTGVFGGKLDALNFGKWTDLEASAHFQDALFRASRKMVQQGDIGMMSKWMANPTAKMILQFKTFSIHSLPNHLLYNIHMRDAKAAKTFMWSTMLGASMYMAQTYLSTLNRPDQDAVLRERFATQKLAAAAFQRSALSSILPMIYDTTVPRLTNTKKVFDTRTSGSSSDLWFSSPLMGAIDNVSTGVGGALAHITGGRDISQAEMRALLHNVPLTGFIGIAPVINHMISGLPIRAPKATEIGDLF